MQTYLILRRNALARAAQERRTADARAPPRRQRGCPTTSRGSASYALEERDGTIGTVCFYEASSPEAIRRHAVAAGAPDGRDREGRRHRRRDDPTWPQLRPERGEETDETSTEAAGSWRRPSSALIVPLGASAAPAVRRSRGSRAARDAAGRRRLGQRHRPGWRAVRAPAREPGRSGASTRRAARRRCTRAGCRGGSPRCRSAA